MKHFFQVTVAATTLFILNLPFIAAGQSTMFTYQGHVTDSGTNFNGSGQFKFALVTASNANFTTYWSNDGTSVNGSEPAAAVSVSVNGGLFTVVLGDTNQPNMAAIDGSLFNRPNLQLRIWFNDGVHGSLALDPPQRLTAAPYAAFANTASNLVNGFTVQANSDGAPNVIGGASLNFVSNGVTGATISGGGASNSGHTNAIYGDFGTVGGGLDNAAGTEATVGGGQGNVAGGGAATVAGGVANTGSGVGSTVSGGFGNMATNDYATVPGGDQNIAGGNVSFAAGFFAQALHRGSFVWSDATLPATPFASTTSNQFSVRANGGVRLVVGNAGVKLGSNAQFFAMAGEENLVAIRGVVDASGNPLQGSAYGIAHTGTGSYTITFLNAFSGFPTVFITPQAGVPRMATTTNDGNNVAQVRIFDASGNLVDAQFHFIAIGPQ